jgi:outer membrane protein assembly factor BamB
MIKYIALLAIILCSVLSGCGAPESLSAGVSPSALPASDSAVQAAEPALPPPTALPTTPAAEELYLYSAYWPKGCDGNGCLVNMWRVFDPAAGRELYSRSLWQPPLVAPDRSRVYIVEGEYPGTTRQVAALDPATRRALWSRAVAQRSEEGGWKIDALSTDGKRLYLRRWLTADTLPTAELYRTVDAASGELLPNTISGIIDRFQDCPIKQLEVGPAERVVYVICQNAGDHHGFGALRVYDADRNVVEQLPLSGRIERAVVSTDGRWLYTVTDNSRIVVIEIAERRVAREIEVPLSGESSQPLSPALLALSADGSTLVVGRDLRAADAPKASSPAAAVSSTFEAARASRAELYVFDTASWQLRTQIAHDQPIGTCEFPATVAVSGDGSTIYAATFAPPESGHCPSPAKTIVAFDAATGKLKQRYPQENPAADYGGEGILGIFIGP